MSGQPIVKKETTILVGLDNDVVGEEVTQCYYVAKASDFAVVLIVADMQHYGTGSIGKCLIDHPRVKQFYSHVGLDRLNESLRLPL